MGLYMTSLDIVSVQSTAMMPHTVFIRIVAAATINFALSFVRLLIEGGSYSRAATITARQYRALEHAQ